jgi:hypothetical protein
MGMNRHDAWEKFADDHRPLLIETGLPDTVTRSEHRFRELLEAGQIVIFESRFSLEELTPAQWLVLYQFARVFFREFESYAPENLFPAFRSEVSRRGDKFPR